MGLLHAIRGIFILMSGILGNIIGWTFHDPVRGTVVGLLTGLLLVLLEMAFARRFIAMTALVMIAVLFGFVLSHFVLAAVHLVPTFRKALQDQTTAFYVDFSLTFLFCFISVIAVLHSRDEFKFVIPFVELRSSRQGRPVVLDSSAIIDGRVADLLASGLIDGPVIVPRFVLAELHRLADAKEPTRRQRGRRGLEALEALKSDGRFEIQTPDVVLPQIEAVDEKLISLARSTGARIVTCDLNLEKIATVQGVSVINLHHLSKLVRPPVLQGDRIQIRILRSGENPGQGVGFLEDGTMVVAEQCARRIGKDVTLVVTNVIPTSAGRIVFAEPADGSQ